MTLSLLPNPSDPAAGFWLNLAGLVLPALFAVGTLVYSIWKRKGRGKRLAYQVVSDVGLINQVKDLGEDVKVTLDGHTVNDARLRVVRLANVGDETITDASLHNSQPIRIEFTPPSVIRCAIHSTEPPDLIAQEHLKDFIRLGRGTECSDGAKVHGFVELPDLVLNAKESINLKLLTRGSADMRVVGHLVGGRISKFKAPSRRTRKRTIVLLVTSGFLAAVALGSGIGFAATFVRGDCALDPGSLGVTGSSAFAPTVQELAANYQSSCPIARLSVSSSSSGDGLIKLERGVANVAMSEVTPADVGISAPRLVENRVAVLVFAVIVHRQVGVNSLSRAQIARIYAGGIVNWREVGGPDLPIRVVGRPADSGTRHAFWSGLLDRGAETAVSDVETGTAGVIDRVSTTPGAIGYAELGAAVDAHAAVAIVAVDGAVPTTGLVKANVYPFWAIERMYTRDDAGQLTRSFVDYVKRNLRSTDSVIAIRDVDGLAG